MDRIALLPNPPLRIIHSLQTSLLALKNTKNTMTQRDIYDKSSCEIHATLTAMR